MLNRGFVDSIGVFGAICLVFLGNSLLIFGIFTWKLFQRDGVGGVAFLLVNDFGIDLSRGHVFMRKHFADGVYICAVANQQSSIGMAEAMESDFLGIR